MQLHTLDKAGIINELQFGTGISHAVEQGRRADFALIMSMFSNDVRDCIPAETVTESLSSESILRNQLGVPKPQALRSDSDSYTISARQAEHFHEAGMASAKLSHYLCPTPLAFMPQDTQDFPEDVYHNLSGHERRILRKSKSEKADISVPTDLYAQLNFASRQYQIQQQA